MPRQAKYRRDELHRRVIRRVRELAAERDIPLSHLPDRLGVGRTHFWEFIGGRSSPTLAWLSKIARELDVDPMALFSAPKK